LWLLSHRLATLQADLEALERIAALGRMATKKGMKKDEDRRTHEALDSGKPEPGSPEHLVTDRPCQRSLTPEATTPAKR
jgi:hypothetical protein